MNLCVIILTSGLEEEDKIPKFLPKVCYQVGEKSMLERCLDNVIQINPSKIILMVSKHHILFINKLVKHLWYGRKISYCIYQNPRKISSAKRCYARKNILVIPANAPLLTSKNMNQIISTKKNVKINNNIFYMKKEDINEIDKISEYMEDDILSKQETLQIETKSQLETVNMIFEKKRFRKKRNKNDPEEDLD